LSFYRPFLNKSFGDDHPARTYIAFEFDPENIGFFERAKFKGIKMICGKHPPMISGIAIMTDRDKTRKATQTCYGDIVMKPSG
jgi:hypothetical protein